MGASLRLHLLPLTLLLSLLLCFGNDASGFKSLSMENSVVELRPYPLAGSTSDRSSKDALLCERVNVSGISRLRLGSYASASRFTLAPSVVIPEKLHSKIQICSHRNSSLGLCRCQKDEWRPVQRGIWSAKVSPYEDQFIDVKFIGDISGYVTITVEEEFQSWRLICIAVGFFLMLAAPLVSSYVPFYYGSSMVIGVLLVVIIILFQGMKLLPTGRKNIFYLSLYGSIVGAGSYLVHYFSMMVNSILVSFGLNEEMYNPVSIFVLVGVIIAGAGLGYYIVRKFVISDDGQVDIGIAQFVKWAMRIVASTFILQGTPDAVLALLTLLLSVVACSSITTMIRKWRSSRNWNPRSRKIRPSTPARNRAEFLSKPGRMNSRLTSWYGSQFKGLVSPPAIKPPPAPEYYSTFHKVSNRKKMSRREWENFTKESTHEAMAGLAASPEFTDWVIKNADRIQLLPDDESSDEVIGSGSNSSEEAADHSGNHGGVFNW